ncbi:MAG: E3 ubiquitin-protein ligase SlrP [Chlamydiae bacterium]|nr:E3 ubiquitin-protein ligase SlrP [Chlamydiota bacterium]
MTVNQTIQNTLSRDVQTTITNLLDIPDLCRFGLVNKAWQVIASQDARWREIAIQIRCPNKGKVETRRQVTDFIQTLYEKGKKLEDPRIQDILVQPKTVANVILLQKYFKARDVLFFAESLISNIQLFAPGALPNLTAPKLEDLTSYGTVIDAASTFKLDFSLCKDQIPVSVTSLEISNKKLTHIPKQVFQITQLTHLYIQDTLISELSEQIGDLSNLQELHLFNNFISRLPENITKLSKLKKLLIKNNLLSELPKKFHALSSLKKLVLGSNRFSKFPRQICDLSNLKKLFFNNNSLSGLPEAVTKLSKLKILDLSKNSLHELPKNLHKLSALTDLYLDNNKFSNFPIETYDLPILNCLSLDHNKLQSIPENRPKNLKTLSVEHNQLTHLPKNKYTYGGFSLAAGNPLSLAGRINYISHCFTRTPKQRKLNIVLLCLMSFKILDYSGMELPFRNLLKQIPGIGSPISEGLGYLYESNRKGEEIMDSALYSTLDWLRSFL